VIRDQAEFEALWAKVYSKIDPVPPVPEIDFSYVMVIAAFQGEKPTSGYEIAFQKRTIVDDVIQVRVFEYNPPPGCGVGAVLTQPYDMVSIPRSDLPVKFKVKQKVALCE
ncbi:MAG TPA: protease complex subunit PrcB family protein, partial [Blastocatellia bacterium]|nr:protease complex subunit PrcB family protein [Blastocatellia bacterium]